MIGIRFRIPNKYNTYLDKILKNVDSDDYIWKIIEDETYKQDGNELFEKYEYSNIDFRNLIENNTYYTIFINIQLYKEQNNDTNIDNYIDFTKSNCELIILITDNEYVDIYAKDDSILNTIKFNAIYNKFSNIEIVSEESHIRKQFSSYTD